MLLKTAKFLTLFCALMAIGYSGSVQAADCVVHFKRTSCTGQEAESYKKCDGKQECDEEEAAIADEAACSAAALAACPNKRVDITKSKVVTATFKGTALVGGFSEDGKVDAKGTNFCAADREDFNKCQ